MVGTFFQRIINIRSRCRGLRENKPETFGFWDFRDRHHQHACGPLILHVQNVIDRQNIILLCCTQWYDAYNGMTCAQKNRNFYAFYVYVYIIIYDLEIKSHIYLFFNNWSQKHNIMTNNIYLHYSLYRIKYSFPFEKERYIQYTQLRNYWKLIPTQMYYYRFNKNKCCRNMKS